LGPCEHEAPSGARKKVGEVTMPFPTHVQREIALILKRARTPWPEPRLYEYRLPAGVVRGFSIDFQGDQIQRLLSEAWLSGHDGIRIIGAGQGLTHLTDSPGYQDSTVFAGPQNGVIQLESLTLHGSQRKAVHCGLAGRAPGARQTLRMRDVHMTADVPTGDAERPVWGAFTYQTDWDIEDCLFTWAAGSEHTGYGHNFAARGARFKRVRFEGSGSEGSKFTQRPWEGRHTANTVISYHDCSFKDWYQPHAWRGGAGVCVQGAGAHIVVERCVFWGGMDSQHCRSLMIDDGGADHYGLDGVAGGYPANGWVIVLQSGFTGRGSQGSSSPFLRVGPLTATTRPVAKGFWMSGCSAYGQFLQLPSPQVPAGRCLVESCNTPALREFAHAYGFDTTHEAMIPLQHRLAPLSEGLVR
jgi:hypothetical protein